MAGLPKVKILVVRLFHPEKGGKTTEGVKGGIIMALPGDWRFSLTEEGPERVISPEQAYKSWIDGREVRHDYSTAIAAIKARGHLDNPAGGHGI